MFIKFFGFSRNKSMKVKLVTAALLLSSCSDKDSSEPAQPQASVSSNANLENLRDPSIKATEIVFGIPSFNTARVISTEPIQVVDSKFIIDKDNLPFKSWVKIKLSGIYEGNLCSGDAVAFQKEYVRGTSVNGPIVTKVFLRSLRLNDNELVLDDMGCGAYSDPTPFTSTLLQTINDWSGGATEKTWIYKIVDTVLSDEVVRKVIRVTFNFNTGWSVSESDQ